MVVSPPSSVGDAGSIPGWGAKIPRAAGQLGLCTTTTEIAHLNKRAHVPPTTEPMYPGACAPQLERESVHSTTRENPMHCNEEPVCCKKKKIPHATTKTQRSQKKKQKKPLNITHKPNIKILVQKIIYKLSIKKKGLQWWGKEVEIGTQKKSQ